MITPKVKFKYAPKKDLISTLVIHQCRNYKQVYVHMHNRTELAVVTTEAELSVFNNGNRQAVKAPCLILHRSGSYHNVEMVKCGGEGYSCTNIFFDEHYAQQIPESLLHSSTLMTDDCLIVEINEEQTEYFQIYLELLEKENTSLEKKLLLLLIILDETNRLVQNKPHVRLNNPNNYIFEVAHYILHHYDEPLTTGEIAAKFHVSVSKINTDFLRITNQTLKEFCTNLRLEHSMDLLTTQDYPIAEVAYRCGFSSESYFIQTFQRHIGTTPNSYRKKFKRQDEQIHS